MSITTSSRRDRAIADVLESADRTLCVWTDRGGKKRYRWGVIAVFGSPLGIGPDGTLQRAFTEITGEAWTRPGARREARRARVSMTTGRRLVTTRATNAAFIFVAIGAVGVLPSLSRVFSGDTRVGMAGFIASLVALSAGLMIDEAVVRRQALRRQQAEAEATWR